MDAMDFSVVDDMLQVSDQQAFEMAREMARKEGLFAGGSSGAAMWGAREVARRLGPGKKIITILPDTGFRYLSKFYNDGWMDDQGYPV